MTWALLMEIYRDYGMKFEEAHKELQKAVSDPETAEGQKARAPNNEQSMAMLQAMIGGSDFGGPRG